MDKDDPRIHQAEEYHRIAETDRLKGELESASKLATTAHAGRIEAEDYLADVRALAAVAREVAAELDAAARFGSHPLAQKLWDALKPFEEP
jgi:hypothetical protein